MIVVIKGKEYKFEFNSIFGPIYTFELVAGDKLRFDPSKAICLHILYWCILYRANDGFDISLDDFFSELNDLSLVKEMSAYYNNRMKVLTIGIEEEAEESEEDKKKG